MSCFGCFDVTNVPFVLSPRLHSLPLMTLGWLESLALACCVWWLWRVRAGVLPSVWGPEHLGTKPGVEEDHDWPSDEKDISWCVGEMTVWCRQLMGTTSVVLFSDPVRFSHCLLVIVRETSLRDFSEFFGIFLLRIQWHSFSLQISSWCQSEITWEDKSQTPCLRLSSFIPIPSSG